ncbi:MAG: hypothetical protein AAFX06_12025 [Planctomycetota bacterium]
MAGTVVTDDFGTIASGLMSQQLWCFGQDVKRPEGNWLVELGFHRTPPPEKRKDCASLYTLDLSEKQRIVLRGFGVFLGDDSFGGLFIERYCFRPLLSTEACLVKAWACEDLPDLHPPKPEQDPSVHAMLLTLVDWLISYEAETMSRLGIGYRQRTLQSWNNGERWSTSAEDMIQLWKRLFAAIQHREWDPIHGGASDD